ncbi:hypothetical protein OGATHE_004689 [Ogataea polymorpha]|uniref:Uncharacterized protein n=1 Tax=Ogataea polymorpha TaxID=460523 RepID=A0A9P8NZK4_9ASCO|nr:hypothetical protein OGATHE_004689 [Ogataea polymorpha]
MGLFAGSNGTPAEAGAATFADGEKLGMSSSFDDRSANLFTSDPVGVNEGVSMLNFLRAPESAVSDCTAKGEEPRILGLEGVTPALAPEKLSEDSVVDADIGSDIGFTACGVDLTSLPFFLEGSSWLKEQPFFSHLQKPCIFMFLHGMVLAHSY